jgi:hypothetical protein
MKRFIAACGLALTLGACGSPPPTTQPTPPGPTPIETTDPTRPIVCIINTPTTDRISYSVTSPAPAPQFTIFKDAIGAPETVHKFCMTVTLTDVQTNGTAEAPVEMILQRTANGTVLQQLSSKSFAGEQKLTVAGVGGQTLGDGTFAFFGMANSAMIPITWTVSGYRQRIQ